MTEVGGHTGLHVLDDAKPMYVLPDPSVAREVLNPALQACERFDLMAGYFSGAVLAEISHGLAAYITGTSEPLRLLVSPVLTEEDQEAIREGVSPDSVAESAIEAAFSDAISLQSALARHTKRCLSYLLATSRLEMKVVVMRDGIFHPKQWTFVAGDDVAVLSGSANATKNAVTKNVEQLRLDLNWRNSDARTACEVGQDFFETYWHSRKPEIGVAVAVSEALARELLQGYESERPPTEAEYRAALQAEGIEESVATIVGGGFAIPAGLQWDSGPYGHQGEAVRAWEANGDRGVMAIATGGGKTICSLVAAHRLTTRAGSLFILVSAPTKPLVTQWATEMSEFGLDPYVQSPKRRSDDNAARIDARMTAVQRGLTVVDSAVITNDLLNSEPMRKVLRRHSDYIHLIGDEAHNLGSERFISDPPEVRYRLGLSATPQRQYDPEGTQDLFDYFGGVVYEFGLDRAIGLCLVPYDYFIHEAHLSADEMEEYRKLSADIRTMYARLGDSAKDNLQLQRKLFRRRGLLESAVGKIGALRACLTQGSVGAVRHTLIYATDKNPEQLKEVNALLRELGIKFHQLTQDETQDGDLVADLVARFRAGHIQVLTAKRVLDEGFNIPEIATAYVLASTTVERQWTQRRGRILRLCSPIGKTKATLHDILALPPADEGVDEDVQRLVKGELLRVDEFARLSSNRHARNGAYSWYQQASLEYRVWVE